MKKYQTFLAFFLLFILNLGIVVSSKFYSENSACETGIDISGDQSRCSEDLSVLSGEEETEMTEPSASVYAVITIIIVVAIYIFFKKFNKKYFKKKGKK